MRILLRKSKPTQQATAAKSSIHSRPPLQRTGPDLPVQRLLRHDTDNAKEGSIPTGPVRSGHDFSRVAVHAEPLTPATGRGIRRIFSGAASASPSSIPFRKAMEFSFGEDFSGVRAYLGQGSSM